MRVRVAATAALNTPPWGPPQIMEFNHEAAGFTGGTTSVVPRIANISPSEWIALSSLCRALMLALQILQGRSVDYDEGVLTGSPLRYGQRSMTEQYSVFSSAAPVSAQRIPLLT